jgi:hypothetical protein
MSNPAPTDTVVLVHGLWMTPRSWEHWVPYYEAKGYRVVTPAYPGFDIEVEALRENPDLIAKLSPSPRRSIIWPASSKRLTHRRSSWVIRSAAS